MEFDLDRWHQEPASRWLVKLANEQVLPGTIHAFNDAGVVVHSATGTTRLEPREVDWIRPLIEVGTDDWTVVAGFQAEDTTFDTWWMKDEVLLRINFSAPTGFSDLVQIVSPRDRPEKVYAPSPGALAQVRPQMRRILTDRRGQNVPPIAHLQ